MNAKRIELAERRAALVARAAIQRAELLQALAPWRRPLAVVDQCLAPVRYIGSHPALLVGAMAFMAVIRPKRMARWLQSGWWVWRTARAVKQGLRGL